MDDRVAVVTGGSRGIGAACVERLVADGLHVVAVGRDEQSLADVVQQNRGKGHGVEARRCDLANEAEIDALFEDLGRVDVLVNNAGVSSSAPVHDTQRSDFDHAFRLNSTSAFLCTRAVLPAMRAQEWGRVVFVASISGVVGFPYTVAYTASKHAVVGIMRVVAAEVAGTGVTSNAICPGYVRSRMTDESVGKIMSVTGRDRDAALAAIESTSPLGRLLEPTEVAHGVAYLCSELTAAVNGQVVVLDGGGVQH